MAEGTGGVWWLKGVVLGGTDGCRWWNQCTFLSSDHFSSVIFRHNIVYLQLQGRIVNSLYHISRLKLISPIASHRQGDRPYQMPRSCQCCRVCHLEPRRLFIYSSKDSLMWGWRGRRLALCLILRAGRQSQTPTRDPGFGLQCADSIIWCSFLSCILSVIMYLWKCISPWLPRHPPQTSSQGVSQILTQLIVTSGKTVFGSS